MELTLHEGGDVGVCYTVAFRIIHWTLELRLFPPPTSPSTAHRTTGEVGERTTCYSTDWTLCVARGMRFGVGEGSTIG